MDESVHKPCTSSLRRVSAKAEQAIINGHESIKQFCFVDKKSNICSLCKCVPQNAFVQWTLINETQGDGSLVFYSFLTRPKLTPVNRQICLNDKPSSFSCLIN